MLGIIASLLIAMLPDPRYPLVPDGYAEDVCSEVGDVATRERDFRRCMAAEHRRQERLRAYSREDIRCTLRYQIRTRWQFYADDRPNCPNLRRPR